MWKKFKRKLYFLVAAYFVFWAKLVLVKWRPRIVVVTGSTGKTTLFYLLKAQLGEVAEFAEEANSAFGIPFHLLGLKRKTFSIWEWPKLILLAPWGAVKPLGKEKKKIYVVEADSDRAGEARVLAKLLQPNIVCVTNIFKTHAQNFEHLVELGKEPDVLTAIANEFVTFAAAAKEEVLVNGNNEALVRAIERIGWQEKVEFLEEQDYLADYRLDAQGTMFVIENTTYNLPALLPREVWLSLVMTEKVTQRLGRRVDPRYQNLSLPAGRSSLLAGVKGTVLIDSTYNANLGSMTAILKLFEAYPAAGKKWLVLGHMLEEGRESLKEHEDLAWVLVQLQTVERVLLLGKENQQATLGLLQRYWTGRKVEYFASPKLVLENLQATIQGGETILFKGAPFLEGVVEKLLANPADGERLVRREAIWQKRRQSFYE